MKLLSESKILSRIPRYCLNGIFMMYLGVLGCASSAPTLKTPTLIGVVSPQRILEETELGKSVNESLSSFMKDRQALIELEQRELRNWENEILRQGSVLSQSARQEREEQFRRRMADYQRKVADLNREVQEKQKELMDDFRSDVEQVISRIAEDRELSLVVEHGTGTSTLFFQPQLDISEEVIQAINQE